MMRRRAFERVAARLAFYWMTVVIALIVAALLIVLAFKISPELSHEWQRWLNRDVTKM